MQLTINNQIAEIKKGTTIKLTRVNPYFADQGDYTLEVQLPLRGCPTNLAIFGPRNHPATTQYPHIGEQYTMQLIAPPLQLEGTATVTSITETEVKVQLKAGVKASPLNNDTTYIDELPLGNAWDGFGSVQNAGHVYSSGTDVRTQIIIFSSYMFSTFQRTTTHVWQAAYGTYGQTDAICLPIYSSTDDIIANPMDMITTSPSLGNGIGSINDITLAPCPYLLDITARIFKCLGFTPRDWKQYTENPLTRGIYIANTRQTLQRAAMLPHWTVKEYLNELQNLLGCVFTFNGRYVDMYTRQHFYTEPRKPITITQVSDAHTINISTDPEAETTANGNVDYDYPNISPMLRLPDEVWENATILPTATYEEAKNHYDQLTDYYKKQSPYLYTVTPTNRAYAILITDLDTPVLSEVDQFAPLMRTTDREQMTKLRITPANMLLTDPYIATNHGQLKDPTTGRCYPIIAVADTILTKSNIYSVNNAINPPETDTTDTTTEAKDHIDIAWYNGESDTFYQEYIPGPDGSINKYFNISLCPIAIPYTIASDGPRHIPATLQTRAETFPTPEGPFALTTKGPTETRAKYGNIGQLLTTAPTIDTRIELQAQFTDTINPDPTQSYLIGSRRYACARLEITIDQNGIQPLKQAYLYEIQ